MARFHINNYMAQTPALQTLATTTTGWKAILVGLGGSTPRRYKVYDIQVGSSFAPGDTAVRFQVERVTATGSLAGTAMTPTSIDGGDSAASSVSFTNNCTTDPTIAANNTSAIWYIAMNQRASYRWVAAPGSELVAPATQSAGLTIRATNPGSTAAITAEAGWYYEEQ